ncbi:MAG: bifunctional phosphopantothenoylcysteine decarboxylase/phosphopantothenate--cysteine ligase CoaBC [Dehalococcoidia bacterium]|jgi:phosphopantothenoylcysteine decarboxylase/phosphopantothenate--cysteine ligase|nr:bifunctional phosphopantothenoylcysteine decarboxylase/phosphopantothenate--cysteine ligase CoaBC [Dehalococcoidia bacterium]MDP7469977.1 bifunctional phosphopantothenoylcysteine decarboxylase/phosphopantothenate--cysteine ligase CoaBC [Dehalococcoidia bacterium]
MRGLEGKNIVLGVCGGIAAYKIADLASKLTQDGATVYVLMTQAAQEFVTPLTFRSLTGQPVTTDMFDGQSPLAVQHVALAGMAHAVVVAPATANTLARLASGMADDPVSLTVLATTAPVLLTPAMDGGMWENPATKVNLAKLRERGFTIAGPVYGRLASGKEGWGRMEEPAVILDTLRYMLGRDGDLAGKKIVVTAGGTQEPLDPVRHLTNPSSGKMGFAVAEAARDRGARAVLVYAPTHLTPPVGVKAIPVRTAQEMQEAIDLSLSGAHALVMAAAVADFRPVKPETQKVKKEYTQGILLELERTPDILKAAQGDFIRVGFAAESQELLKNATDKLRAKSLHLIAANDITATDSGFATDANRCTLLDREGGVEELPLLPKLEVAHRILDRVVGYLKPPDKK